MGGASSTSWKGWCEVRGNSYSMFDWLTTVLLVVVMWALFFVSVGFLARAAKELFCFGFGC